MINIFVWKSPPKKTKKNDSSKKQKNLFYPFLLAGGQILLFLLCKLLHTVLMAGDTFELPTAVCVLFCTVIDSVVFVNVQFQNKKIRRIFKKIGFACLALFLAEIVVFNGKSFTTDQRQEVITADQFVQHESENIALGSDFVTIHEPASIDIDNLPNWTGAVTLRVRQGEHQRPFKIRLFMKDDNFSIDYQLIGSKMTSGYGRDIDFSVAPFGNFYSLRVEFSEMGTPVNLYQVICTAKVPFYFNSIRFISLFLIVAVIILILEFGLQHLTYDHNNLRHKLAFCIMTLVCIASMALFWIPDQEPINYPEGFNIDAANPYEQMLDAFENGHLHINTNVDERLGDLGDSVYDRNARDATGAGYLFDRAYYNGKFYSYFGVAPVLTFYYPYYWIKGTLPTLPEVNFFYSLLAVPFLCLTILAIVRLYCKNTNLLLLLISLPTATALSGIYYCVQFPNLYNVVVASGFFFLFLSLWLGFQAVLTKKKWLRITELILSGISCVLCVASRPTLALGCLLLVPAFLGILRKKDMSLKYRIGQAAGFTAPVLVGAVAIMVYNNLRFGSPFDFGAGYQLTISNIHANHLRLSAIPAAIYHYFLQLPTIKNVFPYFTYSFCSLENYSMYSNLEIILGVLTYPMLLLGILMMPKFFSKRLRIGGTESCFQTKAFVAVCFGLSVVIAWINMCMAGVSLRYQMDIQALVMFASLVVIFNLIRSPKRYNYSCTIIVIIMTFAMLWLLMLHITTTGLMTTTLITEHPTMHEVLEDTIIFWD